MATKEYQIQGEHTTGLTAKHYHDEVISTLNTWAKNNLPPYAVVSSVKVKYRGKVSTGDTKFYVGFTNSSDKEPGQKIISGELTTSSNNSWEQSLPFSGLNITSSYSRLNFWASSGIIMKKYTCYDFRVIWTYSIPNYTVTVKAGTGGTVSGGGTYEAGTMVRLEATPNAGYKFKQWSDGTNVIDGDGWLQVTVNSNKTYTAEFERILYEVTVECQESESGEKCTVSGGGMYYYGDTITLSASSIPNHRISYWKYKTARVSEFISFGADAPNTVSVVLNEETFEAFSPNTTLTIHFKCCIEHTGYLIKVNLSPDNSVGTIEYGDYITVEGVGRYYKAGEVFAEGFNVKYSEREVKYLKAIPNKGYHFLKWENGDASNPRRLSVTGDTTYTAYFGVNRVLGQTRQAKKLIVNLDEVKKVLVNKTVVYDSGFKLYN